MCTERQKIRI